ncbi:MAG TPA: ATP-binding protein [Telluria sp.]|nr:ATP-binding protein [Telluria sp.]
MEPTANYSARNSCNFSTRFDARLEAVPAAQAFVAQGLLRNGVAQDLVARSELILEELMRNAILHGYRGDSLQPLWVGVEGGKFWLEDQAPPFDPLTAHCAHGQRDMRAPAEQLEVGGVGLLLIRRLAKQVEYVYADERNRITVSW